MTTNIKIELLKSAKDLQGLKKLYFELAKKLHPDMPTGNTAKMQQLNNEYDYLKTVLKNAKDTKKAEQENIHTMSGFQNIIDELIKYKNITIQICGSWLWVEGRGTFAIKQEILYDKLHFEYSKSNKKFYWFEGIENSNKCKGGYLKQAIDKYGVTTIQSKGSPALL